MHGIKYKQLFYVQIALIGNANGADTNLILKTFEKVYNLYKMNCLSNKALEFQSVLQNLWLHLKSGNDTLEIQLAGG